MSSTSRKPLTPVEERKLALLSPMWQRIARGEIDLTLYSDDEILSGRLKMEDGRETPKPRVYPQTFIDEQTRRNISVAQQEVRDASIEALRTIRSIARDETAANKDRLAAAKFIVERHFGREPQRVQVSAVDKIEDLFTAVLDDPDALLPEESA